MTIVPTLNRQENSALIAALVPAYNEAGRISAVVRALCQVKMIHEIIVINDGSTDATEADARQAAGNDPRLVIVRHKKNLGKGQALFTGCSATQAKYIVMLDADLIGLKPAHIENLVSPVIAGEAEMAVGIFKHGNWRADVAQWITPWLSGQRCLHREHIDSVCREAAAGYGFETALTLASHQYGWRVKKVPLVGVTHVLGELPRGGWHGPKQKIQLFAHIFRAWWVFVPWHSRLPAFFRMAQFELFVALAVLLSVVNGCATLTLRLPSSHLYHLLDDETLWMLWGNLKTALDSLN